MTDAPVRFELRDAVAVVTLDDGKANALSPGLMRALDEAIDRAAATKEAKAVALFGRPGRFSAGFDLSVMSQGPAAARALVAQGAELFMKIYALGLPVVAGVSGHAIAGGVLLAACADHRVGIEGEFKLGLNEIGNGMPVPILAHQLAEDRLLPTELTRAVLFSHIYGPAQAVAAGWLDEVVAPDALIATVLERANALAKLPAGPFALTKQTLRARSIDHIRTTLDANLDQFAG